MVELPADAAWTWLGLLTTLCMEHCSADITSLSSTLLEGVDDLSILTHLTDETLLSALAAAVDVGTGKLNYLGEEGSKLPIYHLLQVSQRVQVDMLQ